LVFHTAAVQLTISSITVDTSTPTAARRISFKDSLVFEHLHEQTYRDFGFLLVEVPAGPLTERATLIEQTVERLRR
jgi:predicted ATPase